MFSRTHPPPPSGPPTSTCQPGPPPDAPTAAHDAAVRHFFREGGPHAGRMLPVSFVRGEGWETLAAFLGLRDPPPGRFPKADVFDVSAKAQPLWQLQNLWAWISEFKL